MRFTCRLCFHPTDTADQILDHARTAHPEMGDLPTTWPTGWDVIVQTWVGDELTHTKAWRREDFR